MALGLAAELRERGAAQPAVIVTSSPWVDLAMTNPDIRAVAKVDPALNPEHLAACGRAWAGADDVALPRLSPVHASLRGLGRVTMFAGTHDVLWPDARRLHLQADAEGVEHGWFERTGGLHAAAFTARDGSATWDAVLAAFGAATR